jgi:precorrin-3B synthase
VRGLRVGVESVVAAMLAVAEDFLAERAAQDSRAWRIAELAGGGAPVLERLRASGWPVEDQQTDVGTESVTPVTLVAPRATDPGLVEQRDGRFAVCALTPLGLLTAEQALALAAAAELSASDRPRGALRITPWRRVVVRDLELPAALAVRELLSSVGLVVEPGTAWSRLTACAGRPGCAKSLTDVHEDVRAFAAIAEPTGPALHWAGCERSCGTPSGADVVRVLATEAGYRLEGDAELAARDLVGIGMPVQREPGAAAGSALTTGIGGTA